MRIGINLVLWTGHVTERHFHLFDQLRRIGFDGIEVPIVVPADVAHYRAIGRAANDSGLACTAATIISDPACDPISPDAADRRRAVAYLRAVVDRAHALKADVLMGAYFQVLGRFTGHGPSESELERAAEVLREVASRAQAARVRCAIEPVNRFEAHLLNNAAQAEAFVARVGHANLGIAFDTFHAHIEERDPVGAVATLHRAGALAHVHISENHRGVPGRGHAKLRETVARLTSLDYRGWLTIEAFGDAEPALLAATKVWRPLVADPLAACRDGYQLIKSTLLAEAPELSGP